MSNVPLTRFGFRAGAAAAALALVGVLSLVVFAGAQDTLDPAKATVITRADAIAAVVQLAKVSGAGMRVGDPETGAFDRFYWIDGPGIAASVDVNDGRVITLVFTDRAPADSKIAISSDDAVRIADQFLQSGEVTLGARAQPTVTLVNRGEANEYTVLWELRVNGAIVPVSTMVGIDAATGQVFRFHNLQRSFVDPGDPKVGESEAVEIAIKQLGDAGVGARSDAVQLRVTFDEIGTQMLVWQISISAPAVSAPEDQLVDAHFVVQVDAISGKASILGQS